MRAPTDDGPFRDLPDRRADPEAAALVDAAVAVLDGNHEVQQAQRRMPEVRAILGAPDELRRRCIVDAVARTGARGFGHRSLLSLIARKRVELSASDIEVFLAPSRDDLPLHLSWQYSDSITLVSGLIEHAYPGLPAGERERLRLLVKQAAARIPDEATAKRLRRLVTSEAELDEALIAKGDDVGERVRAVYETSPESAEACAVALRLLASFPASGKPPMKWHAEAERVRGVLADPAALTAALLDAAIAAEDKANTAQYGRFAVDTNEAILCGVATFAGLLGDPALLPQLRRLAAKSVIVIGGQFGKLRSLRLANACAKAIADVNAPASITELLALERGVRHGTLLRQIRKAIDELAAAQGLTRDELLERAVESHGLDADGTRRVPLSRGEALIEVEARAVTLAYLDESGKRLKSVPADVKEVDAETLEVLRGDLKAIRKTIAGERHRLDGLMTLDRRWPLEQWRELYLDHPVTGRLARSLVWGFRSPAGGDVLGVPRDATVAATSSGEEVAIPDGAEVRLWHPINSAAEDVRAWRLHLLEQLIVQPFKQAFRELYVLTPAEEQTRVYSNRFAGHVFRQVQARALMKGRGWRPVAVAWWDDGIDHGVARRTYEPFRIRAEFFFDPIQDLEPTSGDLYPYCTSDQVRFFSIDGDDPLALADVPILVLTEAMRDVDLFIGVTSIGADPEWLDGGGGRRFETYWHRYGFGDLTAAAEIRREVIERLLPVLAIADRCELEERFLAVRGDLRSYRIHLGSGNILMAPNDKYLCIVAARDTRAQKLFVPFDDDPVLSLILSKAFLLAADTAITDPTIVSQIKAG